MANRDSTLASRVAQMGLVKPMAILVALLLGFVSGGVLGYDAMGGIIGAIVAALAVVFGWEPLMALLIERQMQKKAAAK